MEIKEQLLKIKEEQTAIIEGICTAEPWVKQEIITICDEQISKIPELDRERYIYLLKTIEHPEGYRLTMDVHPCMRIREGVIVRDTGNTPESFFWSESAYEKMKEKAQKGGKNYFIGGETGEYLENFVQLRNKITNKLDGRQLSFKVARSRNPLEVFELPAIQRTAVLVTEELADALGSKLIASYNMDDPNYFDPVEPGDILVQEDLDEATLGFYYRVDMRQVAETYRRGTL